MVEALLVLLFSQVASNVAVLPVMAYYKIYYSPDKFVRSATQKSI